ncbi:brain tumor protein-like isoform X3 [Musca domestica]|uniref:Brain tumor protein-like isoform X3 n=1 Tax=Musca domestica TaxID=7370 RepID=A0ABM3UZQ4_MUSDO|nr:brain tumor protein-like isoform X3 [Musca domestica]
MATIEDFVPHILKSTTVTPNPSSVAPIIANTADANNCTFTSVLESSSITAVAKALEASSFITSSSSASTVDSIVDKLVNSLDLNDSLISNSCNPIAKDLKSISSRSSSVAGSLSLGGLGGGNMFSEVFESNVGSELESGSLEDSSGSLGDGDVDKNCKICSSRLQSPRVLSCLHVFCESCLNKLLNEDSSGGNLSSSSSTSSVGGDLVPLHNCSGKSQIRCPICKQITMVGPNGVQSLTCDYILTNILDLATIESEQLYCTSCKSKENAISRCNDCANFLCSGCDNAHKYMRCFENHEVVKLEDLQKTSDGDKPLIIHKPLYCNVHTSENLKYYCFNCQIPVCNDCLIADHKGSEHHYDIIALAEKSVRGDVENLIKEAKSKVQYCDDADANLCSALNELQSQHDSARDLIQETYENYKKIIEKCRDQALVELKKLHSERVLKIMDLMQNIQNTMGKIDNTCKFTNRVLEQANAAEFLSMKKLIATQFINMINTTPKCDINYSLTFDTKPEKFEQLAQETFGKFRTESTPPSPKESTPPPTLPGMPPNMMNGRVGSGGNGSMNCSNSSQSQLTSSVTASSPISLPTSMQSSFDGDIYANALGNGFMMSNVLTPDSPPQGQSALSHHHHQLQHQNSTSSHHSSVNGFNSMGSIGPGNGNSLNNNLANSSPGFNGSLGNSQLGAGPGASLIGPQGLNGLNNTVPSNGLSALNNPLNNSLSAAVGGPLGGNTGVAAVPPPGGYNSILEYNLSRLASLTENTPDSLTDALVGSPSGPTAQSVVPAANAQNQPITLADILSGDQRAFNNLQALAKLGLNNNDYCLPTAPSPSLPNLPPLCPGAGAGGSVDDMSITSFHAPQQPQPTATSIITGRNKATPMQIRCKFGSLGTSKGQFNSPHGFCLGVDEEIIVADTNNHRIEIFDKSGNLKFYFGVPGKEEGQLWYPRKVAVMHTNGKFVVCDRGNERSRMQIFSKSGHFMRKIAIRYIDIVAGLAVTSKGHIVAVDSVSPTVFVISEDGELVRWFDCSDYMREPSDIAIRDNDFYVCDFKGHCVAVFHEDGTFQYRIGNEKVTCFPNGIDISNAGDILIGDSHGNRFHVACYSRDGVLQSEFECPHVKVSRCCGLKITSEGYVVTLAKNNHHVLVLNTLYVQ